MSLKAVPLFAIGLLAVTGVVGLLAIANGQHSRSIPMSDLAQLVKQGEIARIEVSGESAVATTRQQDTFGLRVEPFASLAQQLGSFGVSADELSQINYSVADPPQLGLVATAVGTLLPVLLLGGLVVIAIRGGSKPHDMFSFGKTRVRAFDADRPRISFNDVAGLNEAK